MRRRDEQAPMTEHWTPETPMEQESANFEWLPTRPRIRVLQNALAIAVFSLVPLWPANAGASVCPAPEGMHSHDVARS
jgi:hypothetical protein